MFNFQKILKLVKKTGDKYILADETGEPSYVVMSLEEYYDLCCDLDDFDTGFDAKVSDFMDENNVSERRPLTEKQVLDKINRELAEWQKNQEQEELSELEQNLGEFEEEEDRYYLEPIE